MGKHYTDRKFFKAFKKIDLFARPIELQFDQKENYYTYCGAILTFLIFIICTIYFSMQMYNYILVKNPKIIQGQLVDSTPSYLSSSNFTVAFSLRGGNRKVFFDKTMISYQAYYNTKSRDEYGQFSTKKDLIPLVNCSEISKQINSTNYLCLDLSSINNLQLVGDYNNELFQYISINVRKCANSTQMNYTCAPQEIINSVLFGSIFQVVFTNNILDFENSDNQITSVLAEAHTGYMENQSKEVSIYMEKVFIEKKVFDLLPSDEQQTLIYSHNSEMSESQQLGQVYQGIIRQNNISTNYSLYNENIFFIFSQLGGLWNFLLIAFGVVIQPFRELSRKMSIINRIFLFERVQIVIILTEQPIDRVKVKPLIENQSILDREKEYKKFRLTPVEYISYFLPKRCFCIEDYKINQLEYATQQIWEKMDIVFLLKRMNWIEKQLKQLCKDNEKERNQFLARKVIKVDVLPTNYTTRSLQKKLGRKNRLLTNVEDLSLFDENSYRSIQDIELEEYFKKENEQFEKQG